MSVYVHRVLKYAWGVSIEIRCESFYQSEYHRDTININRCIALSLPDGWILASNNIEAFKRGVELIEEQICKKITKPIVVEIEELNYTITEFQVEGLGYAFAGWLIQEYELNVDLPEVSFDKENNVYIYPFKID